MNHRLPSWHASIKPRAAHLRVVSYSRFASKAARFCGIHCAGGWATRSGPSKSLTMGARAPRQYMTSEYDDDKTCRSFMKHKASDDESTYQDCRKSLVDIANMTANMPVAAPPSNVTIIVNQ